MTGNGDISIKRLKDRAEDDHQTVAMPLMPDRPKQVTVGYVGKKEKVLYVF